MNDSTTNEPTQEPAAILKVGNEISMIIFMTISTWLIPRLQGLGC